MNWNDCQSAYGEEEAREDLQGEELEKGITVFYGLSDHQKRCQVFVGNPVSMTSSKDKNSQSCLCLWVHISQQQRNWIFCVFH